MATKKKERDIEVDKDRYGAYVSPAWALVGKGLVFLSGKITSVSSSSTLAFCFMRKKSRSLFFLFQYSSIGLMRPSISGQVMSLLPFTHAGYNSEYHDLKGAKIVSLDRSKPSSRDLQKRC